MSPIDLNDMKAFLDEKAARYNALDFIKDDPISIPHQFTKKEDIEISAFITATIAWGQRITILNNMNKMMSWMDDTPWDFINNHQKKDLIPFSKFTHRTFNGTDCVYFIKSIKNIYLKYGGLEEVFNANITSGDPDFSKSIHHFKKIFFSLPHSSRTQKHVSDPMNNSSSKRICMFLRWMVRKDKAGVDFGIWNQLGQHRLSCPLDVHSGRVARKLGLLKRTQNDWKAVCELTANLKALDPKDPVKYDYALFGLGVNEKF